MRLATVIVTWNSKEEIDALLRDLRSQEWNGQQDIIVVDNASTDGTADHVRHEFPNVRIEVNTENVGFTRAANQGLRLSNAPDAYLFANPDLRVPPGTVGTLMAYLETHSHAGVAGPTFEDADGRSITKTTYPRFLRAVAVELKYSWFNDSHQHPTGRRRASAECLSGAFLVVRKAVFDQVGLFDERYWAYFEETDLCLRARRAGWEVALVNEARTVHIVGKSFSRVPFVRRVRWNESICRFYDVYHPRSARLYRLLVPILWRMEYAVRLSYTAIFSPARLGERRQEFLSLMDTLKE